MDFTSQTYAVNGQSIHVMAIGPEDAQVILMLHGFPEYWKAWADVARHLSSDHRVVLPDQRGYNLSSKPELREDYETKHLTEDMVALLDIVSPNSPAVICGHDWGASVAYALAMHHAHRVSHLIIANGVHPMCFQKALYAGGAQTDASQYMNVLKADGVEDRLSANNFKKLLDMFEKFSAAPWLDNDTRDEYRNAWSHPCALTAMLNWYRAARMDVPQSGELSTPFPITEKMKEQFKITVPHLLLWGLKDTALLPEAREDLHLFCKDLTLEETEIASHWILHEQPQWVAENIVRFLTLHSSTMTD